MEWISAKDRLPEENEYVLILMGSEIEVARIEKGISEEERAKMKSGELPDEEKMGYIPGRPPFTIKRSDSIKDCDQWGNNTVPYKWYARSGPMQWWGQNVTHWMPLPEPPHEKKCCESCANLVFYECPSEHYWCDKNKECPCNGDEVPSKDFFCESYRRGNI